MNPNAVIPAKAGIYKKPLDSYISFSLKINFDKHERKYVIQ